MKLKTIDMKKTILLLCVIFSGILVATWYACESDPEEYCEQDLICEEYVTVCCTGDVCVYKFDGKEYPDTDEGVNQLAEDMGCGTTSIVTEDGILKKNFSGIIDQLKAFMNRVRESARSFKEERVE